MPQSRQNIRAHELIGLPATVTGSADPTTRGLSGTVTYETRNTLTLRTLKGNVIVPKRGSEFAFTFQNGQTVHVEGKSLRLRPEDRLKRGIRS